MEKSIFSPSTECDNMFSKLAHKVKSVVKSNSDKPSGFVVGKMYRGLEHFNKTDSVSELEHGHLSSEKFECIAVDKDSVTFKIHDVLEEVIVTGRKVSAHEVLLQTSWHTTLISDNDDENTNPFIVGNKYPLSAWNPIHGMCGLHYVTCIGKMGDSTTFQSESGKIYQTTYDNYLRKCPLYNVDVPIPIARLEKLLGREYVESSSEIYVNTGKSNYPTYFDGNPTEYRIFLNSIRLTNKVCETLAELCLDDNTHHGQARYRNYDSYNSIQEGNLYGGYMVDDPCANLQDYYKVDRFKVKPIVAECVEIKKYPHKFREYTFFGKFKIIGEGRTVTLRLIYYGNTRYAFPSAYPMSSYCKQYSEFRPDHYTQVYPYFGSKPEEWLIIDGSQYKGKATNPFKSDKSQFRHN